MSKPIQDPEAVALYRDQLAPVEPLEVADVVPEARPCSAPVRPGSHNAAAAYRMGCEDEWAERMSQKYGGEW